MNVLLLYNAPYLQASAILCGEAQMTLLQNDGVLEFRHMSINAGVKEVISEISWADIVFFVRTDGWLSQYLTKKCRESGRPAVYVLDDDLLNITSSSQSSKYYSEKSIKNSILSSINNCQVFASPSIKLISMYGSEHERVIKVIEPSLCVIEEKPENERIKIGFAGSADRGHDIDNILAETLRIIKDKYGDKISIEFFGTETQIAKDLGSTTYPYLDTYEEYREMMRKLNWDIGLAPMPKTDFHSCKHYNKLVEYSGYGIAGVYSNVEPYTYAVKDRVNGVCAENTTESWVAAISLLIEDDALRREIAENCISSAKGEYSLRTAAYDLYENIKDLTPVDKRPIKYSSLLRLKLKILTEKITSKFRLYGWKLPFVAVKKIWNKIFRRNKA